MQPTILRSFYCLALTFFLCLATTQATFAYGVLSHQAIIDASWDKELKPLLQKRFPNATDEELKKAHAYAYGGSILQDMGYFPFGNKFFTDLLHYVRSGDFVKNLIDESQNVNEYAFALGTLAHYNADVYGHSIGTNKAVPVVYPKLKQEFGSTVTFADDPVSHVKTEFGFDVLQVARGNYAPEAYQQFIGFEVAQEPLERAFMKTYGLELKEVFVNVPLAIGTYRFTIKNLIPDLTKAAWKAKESDIRKATPDATRRSFTYRMKRAKYESNWGDAYERPGFFTRVMAWVIKVLPKVGPLRSLGFTMPNLEAEKLFYKSFNTTVTNYSVMLSQLKQQNTIVQNLQLDTGEPTHPGDYKLTDETYDKLLEKLSDNDFKNMSSDLQKSLLDFYDAADKSKKDTDTDGNERKKRLKHLAKLKEYHVRL